MSSDLYAQDGVNVQAGDDFSSFAARECAKTSSPFIHVRPVGTGHFRGPRTYVYQNLPQGTEFDDAADGIGTKRIITVEADTPEQSAYDMVAMTSTDIVRWGGKTIKLGNVLDVSTLGKPGSPSDKFFRTAMVGLRKACHSINVLAYRGETAELGTCVGGDNKDAVVQYNWAGFATGIYHPTRMITGATMEPGDVVYAIKEDGFRSNGLSSVRAAFRERFGAGYEGNWWRNPDAREAIIAAAAPSILCDNFLTFINGWRIDGLGDRYVELKCLAHLSGGGIPGKFAKDVLFPLGLSAELTNLFEPVPIMSQVSLWRGMSDRQSYKTFNGGQGILAVMAPKEEGSFIGFAGPFNHKVRRCGVITAGRGTPTLLIHSKFSGKKIPFTPKDEDF